MNITTTSIQKNYKRELEQEDQLENKKICYNKNISKVCKTSLEDSPISSPSTQSNNQLFPSHTEIQNTQINAIFSDLKKILDGMNDKNIISENSLFYELSDIGKKFIVICEKENINNFGTLIVDLLRQIASKKIGNQLLKEIEKQDHYVFFLHNNEKIQIYSTSESKIPGKGSGSLIKFDAKMISCFDYEANINIAPPFIILAHELIHAMKAAKGETLTKTPTFNATLWEKEEEYDTIMNGISENAIRKEHQLPLRYSHFLYVENETVKNAILNEIILKSFEDFSPFFK